MDWSIKALILYRIGRMPKEKNTQPEKEDQNAFLQESD